MATRTLARLHLRLSVRGALIWGAALSAGLTANATAWTAAYPTQESREALAHLLGSSIGFRALAGPPIAVDTIGGFVAWRLGIFSMGMLGVWGLLTTTRLLRGEEDSGRWDVVLSHRLTNRSATAASLAAFGVDLLCLWTMITATLVALGPRFDIPARGSLIFTTALVGGAGAYGSLGALTAQLASTRRAAAGIAGGILAASMAVRAAGDVSGATWLRWSSPLSWLSQVRAYGEARPGVLVLFAGWIAICVAATLTLAHRRDVGTGALPSRDAVVGRTAMLRSPERASARFAGGTASAWIVGSAAFAMMIASVAPSVRETFRGSGIERMLAGLGNFASVRAYLAFAVFLILGFIASVFAGGSVVAHWEEERTARADTVLSGAIGRRRWLGGRIAVTVASGVLLVTAASAAAWAGVAVSGSPIPLPALLVAGLAVLPLASVFLGAGVAVYGLVPRATSGATYGVIVGSFLLEIIGSVSRWPSWILGLSPFHHLSSSPLRPVDVKASLVLLAVGAAGVVLGIEAFARRDVRTA